MGKPKINLKSKFTRSIDKTRVAASPFFGYIWTRMTAWTAALVYNTSKCVLASNCGHNICLMHPRWMRSFMMHCFDATKEVMRHSAGLDNASTGEMLLGDLRLVKFGQ